MPLDLRPDEPIAFLCAVTGPGPEATLGALEELATKFGDVRARGQMYDFDMIDYYAAEMGPGLSKTLAWFGPLVAPAQLAARKQATISFERARADDGRRTVNVDPGLPSANSLVLATTKSSGHRIAIAPSLYAEVTLLFEKGAYCPLPWSYRDMQSREVQTFLMRQRQLLLDAMGGVRRVGAGEVP